jgi:hypothetical protein
VTLPKLHSSYSGFEWHSRFKVSWVSVEDDKLSGQQAPAKRQKMLKKMWELINENCHQTIHELTDTTGISYGVCQILTENLNMHHTAASWQRIHPHDPENHMVCYWQQHGYRSPASLLTALSPCDFALFPKLKMKLRGWPLETVSDIQKESQAVLDSIRENDFHSTSEAWKKTMGSLSTFRRRLLWRRWQPKLSKLSQHFYFNLVRELSNIPHTL